MASSEKTDFNSAHLMDNMPSSGKTDAKQGTGWVTSYYTQHPDYSALTKAQRGFFCIVCFYAWDTFPTKEEIFSKEPRRRCGREFEHRERQLMVEEAVSQSYRIADHRCQTCCTNWIHVARTCCSQCQGEVDCSKPEKIKSGFKKWWGKLKAELYPSAVRLEAQAFLDKKFVDHYGSILCSEGGPDPLASVQATLPRDWY